jgi:hypothetical protein
MKVDTDELIDKLHKMKDSYVFDLIKGGEYSEWNKGMLAGKVDVLADLIEWIEHD